MPDQAAAHPTGICFHTPESTQAAAALPVRCLCCKNPNATGRSHRGVTHARSPANMAASRKFAAVATLRSLLLIGVLLLAMATSPAAVSEEDATIGHNAPLDGAPAPPPANNDGAAFRASSSPAVSSVDAPLPSAPKGSAAAIPPEAAPAPQLRPRQKESDKTSI